MQRIIKSVNLEAGMWLVALVALAFIDPLTSVSICPLHQLGIDFCPGCGLGASISHLLHGEFMLSVKSHPLGGLAIGILIFRVFSIIRHNLKFYGPNH